MVEESIISILSIWTDGILYQSMEVRATEYRVLVVASLNKGTFAPFIVEQCEALCAAGVKYELFGIEGKGVIGYLWNFKRFRKAIKRFRPDVIHAHYGLSGLFANFQRKVPVVTTYHGSDINDKSVRRFSLMAVRLSAFNIFVSRDIMEKTGALSGKVAECSSLIPCGVNMADLPVINQAEARRKMRLDENRRYILFAGAFYNKVKNYHLAKDAIDSLNAHFMDESSKVELIELKGYSRQRVNLLMNACDALLMTSFTEGSPQVVKEAMAVGCPVVSVDVGDVRSLLDGIEGCYIAARTPDVIVEAMLHVFNYGMGFRTEGRKRLKELGLTNYVIARKVVDVYRKCKKNKLS